MAASLALLSRTNIFGARFGWGLEMSLLEIGLPRRFWAGLEDAQPIVWKSFGSKGLVIS